MSESLGLLAPEYANARTLASDGPSDLRTGYNVLSYGGSYRNSNAHYEQSVLGRPVSRQRAFNASHWRDSMVRIDQKPTSVTVGRIPSASS